MPPTKTSTPPYSLVVELPLRTLHLDLLANGEQREVSRDVSLLVSLRAADQHSSSNPQIHKSPTLQVYRSAPASP